MDRIVADKVKVCGAHFPFPGMGHIAKTGSDYVLTIDKA